MYITHTHSLNSFFTATFTSRQLNYSSTSNLLDFNNMKLILASILSISMAFAMPSAMPTVPVDSGVPQSSASSPSSPITCGNGLVPAHCGAGALLCTIQVCKSEPLYPHKPRCILTRSPAVTVGSPGAVANACCEQNQVCVWIVNSAESMHLTPVEGRRHQRQRYQLPSNSGLAGNVVLARNIVASGDHAINKGAREAFIEDFGTIH